MLDVGVGMDPALVGQEHHLRFATAVVDYYPHHHGSGPAAGGGAGVERARRSADQAARFRAQVGDHVCEQNGQLVTYKIFVTR